MTFTTVTFALFLVTVWTIYWVVARRVSQNVVLVAASYVFYAWWDYRFCALMLASTVIDFVAALRIEAADSPTRRRAWLAGSIAMNLSMLGFFKYYNFFAAGLRDLAAALGSQLSPITLNVILPVGLSFYTFQTMSYAVDVYRRRLPACRSFLDYLAYVSFFPQLVAGPIERASNLLNQFATPRRFTTERGVDGCRQILWGAVKKMVIADNLSVIVDAVYHEPTTATGPMLWFATICFAFQIYCDFSGYTDIARGTAQLFGIGLTRNFAYPYFSQSPAEFWRRWHMTLSGWFRDYVYVPLGGSRAGRLRTALNVMATFCLSGLWHGASWNFVVWGAINGLAVVPSAIGERGRPVRRASDTPGGEAPYPAPAAALRMFGTFVFLTMTWVLFRANDLQDAGIALGRMVGEAFDGGRWQLLGTRIADDEDWCWTVGFLVAFVSIEWVQRRHPYALARLPRCRVLRWALYSIVCWGVLYWGTTVRGPFIYFQF